MVTLPADALAPFPRFSLYNSPYVSHDEGCAIDLYPGGEAADADGGSRAKAAPSPVAGEVVATRTVDAPSKPYAVERDHLIVVDTGDHLARVLHVDPEVAPGDEVRVGDSLGELVRSGFFAPWVGNHVHLGFRERDADPLRASGSLPVDVAVDVDPVTWDGTGRVVSRGETYVVLDAPGHPAPGERFAGIAGTPGGADATNGGRGVLDGGLPHYEGGGLLPSGDGPVSLAGRRVGTANGRTVAWDDVEVRTNGTAITGVSLFVSREAFGAKLVCPDHEFAPGERVEVTVHR
ncbi:hypothetical protein [Halomicrococcus sp. NG-SE-24]|uniref:hypothetical protein n=1 Tax=Halomicrococcus sp. NG-SE-24 TaxID=3436928 RepID=UPI003D98C7A6